MADLSAVEGGAHILHSQDHIGWDQLDPVRYVCYSGALLFGLDALTYPIDFLKTRQQFDMSKQAKDRSLSHICRTVVRNEGIKGLYRGFIVNSAGSIPGQVVYFGSYEVTKSLVERSFNIQVDSQSHSSLWGVNLAAGFVADIACLLVHTPADVIAQRMMVASHAREVDVGPRSQSLQSIIKSIMTHEGPAGFYRGFGGAVVTFAPSSAIWFATYELAKELFFPHVHKTLDTITSATPSVSASQTVTHLLAGGIAGLTAAVVTNPLDVARTRQQTMDIENPHDAKILKRGYWHVLKWTAKEEGIRGLYRGFVPRLWFAVIGSSLTFAGYEYAKELSLIPV